MENAATPWTWYIIRASALVGFLLLYISIFVGTVSGLPGIRRIFLRWRSLNFHCWISAQALFFAAVHALSLLFDKTVHFSIAGILVPFTSVYHPALVALGTISFYLIIALVLTSYSRRFFSYGFWRTLHFSNIFLYIFSIIHAFYLGTDLKVGLLRQIFIFANGFLLMLLLMSLAYRIWTRRKQREILGVIPENFNANLCQSDNSLGQERNRENFRRRI